MREIQSGEENLKRGECDEAEIERGAKRNTIYEYKDLQHVNDADLGDNGCFEKEEFCVRNLM